MGLLTKVKATAYFNSILDTHCAEFKCPKCKTRQVQELEKARGTFMFHYTCECGEKFIVSDCLEDKIPVPRNITMSLDPLLGISGEVLRPGDIVKKNADGRIIKAGSMSGAMGIVLSFHDIGDETQIVCFRDVKI